MREVNLLNRAEVWNLVALDLGMELVKHGLELVGINSQS